MKLRHLAAAFLALSFLALVGCETNREPPPGWFLEQQRNSGP